MPETGLSMLRRPFHSSGIIQFCSLESSTWRGSKQTPGMEVRPKTGKISHNVISLAFPIGKSYDFTGSWILPGVFGGNNSTLYPVLINSLQFDALLQT
jgi:hypothetical protein